MANSAYLKSLQQLTLGQLRDIYNTCSEKLGQPTISKFADKEAGARRAEQKMDACNLKAIVTPGSDKNLATYELRPADEKAEHGRLTNQDKIIKIVSTKNPKRAGTIAAKFYDCLVDGERVIDFYRRAEQALGAEAGSRHKAGIDLRWNIAHGHIKLVDPK